MLSPRRLPDQGWPPVGLHVGFESFESLGLYLSLLSLLAEVVDIQVT